jgi:hypothetical protein
VHVSGFAADEGFINFDFTRSLPERTALHSKADTMEHEPSRFLRDFEMTRNLARANAVLAIDDQPSCRKPFVESNWGVLENRADLHGILFAACLALPNFSGIQEVGIGSGARGANCFPVRPVENRKELTRIISVAEEPNCLKKRIGQLFHDSTISEIAW